ncbi:UDP-glucose:glycoprotein glucosyltransferase-domain-containing protein [Cokeromyces recurvatus]|uniref:UDP-glucose:glycoprotein glucosyltransferase-domain-containing protein n=1 Tax=Cokeromyces recurvatus TaxID=90255 RepID=UPI00221E5B3E|nr:UDP-glucose:glycoprotein glucosyltransferase-domain-containing protein [Cokeromyces recurvatus]KAI7903194.1 UDP-glucose:glycoprotein glucosyltransferase-domain-containing protein [Cokeromyces recurvatus]
MAKPRIIKILIGLVTIGLVSLETSAESPTVDLTLVAPWSSPNFIVEIAETIATYNETAYFNFIQDFIALEEKSSTLTPQQLYNEALEVISSMGIEETNFFKLSLAVHESAPRIEAYNQYYRESVIPTLSKYDDDCNVWIQFKNSQICNVHQFINRFNDLQQNTIESLDVLPFDHVFNPTGVTTHSKPILILYTDRFSNLFAEFHSFLTTAAKEQGFSYIIRYRPPKSSIFSPLYLSGYGVEMALKKTDYLVIDDRSSEKASKDTIKNKVLNMGKKFEQSLFHTTQKATISPLTPSEIHKLGFKAAQFVAKSSKPLETLNQLIQDFPKYAKSISDIELDTQFEKELLDNQLEVLRAGMNAVWLNGRGLEYSQLDPFFLVRALRSEYKLMQTFKNLGFTSKQAISIISNPSLSSANGFGEQVNSEIYDVRDTPEDPFIIWWNDLEKDKRYRDWASDVTEYTRPIYPGQLHQVRKNVFNLLMVEDLAQVESLSRIVNELYAMVKRSVPIRFGIVPIIKKDGSTSTIMAQALHYMNEEFGKSYGMKFLTDVMEGIYANGKRQPDLEDIEASFTKISTMAKPKSGARKPFEEAIKTQDMFIQSSHAFLKRLGISHVGPENGIMFMNGKLLEHNEEKIWTQVLVPSLMEVSRTIKGMVFTGDLTNDLDFYEFSMSLPTVRRTRNEYIAPSSSHPLRIQDFNHVEKINELKYFQADEQIVPKANIWVLADLNTIFGQKLAFEAINFAENNPNVRVALAHTSANQSKMDAEVTIPVVDEHKEPKFSDLLGKIIFNNADVSISYLKELLSRAIENYIPNQSFKDKSSIEAIIPGSPIIEMVSSEQSKKWITLAEAFEKDGIEKSFFGVIINGRVVGPFSEDTEFTKENFETLYSFEYSKRISPIEEAISEANYTISVEHSNADMLAKLSYIIESDKMNTPKSLIENSEPDNRNRIYQNIPGTKYTRIVIGDLDNSFLEIGMVIDPLSEIAQKWVPIINTLAEIEGVAVVMYLNPVNGLNELPLKRFYRYVFDNEPHFDPTTGVQTVPTAYFADLPVEPLYTLGVDTTNAWHVTVREANMDLDNILLTSLKEENSVSAVYELENILLEGHCLDSANRSPPRGLEIEITSPSNQTRKDTLVMANLGYFQLKALPGVWDLGLREGRSSSIYTIEDIGTKGKWNWEAAGKGVAYTSSLAITSFEGLTVMPLVHKNPGMESEDILESGEHKKNNENNGLWSSLSNKLFGKKGHTDDTNLVSQPKQAEINIFSVASGKLYERFLSIMIASVMKHTNSTVKFWFIENFLSPEFKDFVPYMAEEYGFDYEMVTYKWPAWLRAQHEKQRTIWGYKILFLDVLFPLSLDKVIFVDADQIVRTDLKELVDMDLQGAPYGYTPFCSDRTEMDGFRFWTEGYWKTHLRGKPYHISALYVVDLDRFRQLAAGDRLRAQYQQLSADPNSLANLDQDLPNNMQHIVPIFSLPQEWLWCETWCSDESLKTAKTIDLCNNPLTKEPKLDRARRQVPEWEMYDNEIDKLRKRVADDMTVVAKNTGDQIILNDRQHVKDEL